MNTKFRTFFSALLMASGCMITTSNLHAEPKTLSNSLSSTIKNTLQNQPGDFGIYAAPNKKAPLVCINCDKLTPAASTIKLAVIDAAYQAAKDGKISFNDTIVIHNHFQSLVSKRFFSIDQKEDSYDTLYEQNGQPVKISELLRVMIQYSSNLATNLLVEKLGVPYINGILKQQHLNGMVLGRMIEDLEADDQNIKNLVTARGLGTFLQKLEDGEIVGPQQSQEIIQIMLGQKFNDIIPPLLPKNTPIAHKTGWITGVRNDAAIVTLPNGKKYILVLLSKNLPSESEGIKTFNQVSKQTYDYFIQH